MTRLHRGGNALIAILAALGPITTTPAQELRALKPEAWTCTVDESLRLGWITTHPTVENKPWPAENAQWFFIRVTGTQENRDWLPVEPPPPNPDPDPGVVPKPDGTPKPESTSMPWTFHTAGTGMMGLDLKPSFETLPTDQLATFLEQRLPRPMPRAIADLLSSKPGTITVKRVESAKAFIAIKRASGEREGAAPATTDKSGQQVEIRPLTDPTIAPMGSLIFSRVYANGDAVKPSVYLARHLPSGQIQTVITNDRGVGGFTLDQPGEWSLELIHVEIPKGPGPASVPNSARHGSSSGPDQPTPELILYSATVLFNAEGKP